ncbi:MAG TPA: hypothetical protein VLA36_09615 [Longimicrobiales bacterium]|nr:hypothetical protein [Longimicrobiales bacterium]
MIPSSSVAARPWALALVMGLLLSSACTTVIQQGPGAGMVAQLSLERFLEAANARDLAAMGRSFGTTDGPIMDTGSTFGCMFKKIGSWFGGSPCVQRRDVEVRLAAISDILRHEDFRVTREETVAGRMSEARRIWVDFTINGAQVTDVPFVVVRGPRDQWLVEEIDLQRIMARPGRRD